MKNKFVIAIYMRLSQDDVDFARESSSIINQRDLLRTYAAEHFRQYELMEFQDDGYSGANFDRPGIVELFAKVKEGIVDCIIVKDLSRFSRDYIEIGSYLEQIFPFAGVRFIAVNDGYDSDLHKGDVAGMDTSFKNLINDLYCKDISVKVKSALKVKKEKGIYANGSCPFGYRKDPKDRHRLLIDEEEAVVVRRIFQMTADGLSSHKIAQQFNAEGVKTPIEFKIERGIASMKPKGQSFEWSGSTICQMLRNATYVGDIVYDKYDTPEVSGKARLRPRSEWKVFKNHHEAIIDRAVFEKIQQSRGTKKDRKYARHPLIGKMECGCCHKSLKIARSQNPYFFCANRYVTRYEGCLKQINVQFLEQFLLFRLQEELDRQMQRYYNYLDAKAQIDKALKEISEDRKQVAREQKHLQEQQTRLYEAYVFKEKSREEYVNEKQNLQAKMDKCIDEIEHIDKRIASLKTMADFESIELYEYVQCHSFTSITEELVERFINKIVIYDEERIEVEWNFPEKFSEEVLQYQLALA